MTLEEFRKKLDGDEAFRAEVEAKAKALKEQNPDKSERDIDQMLSAEYGVEKTAGVDINDDDMDAVAGGIFFFGDNAADGHEIFCFCAWYFSEYEAVSKTKRCSRCHGDVKWDNFCHYICYNCKLMFCRWDEETYNLMD